MKAILTQSLVQIYPLPYFKAKGCILEVIRISEIPDSHAKQRENMRKVRSNGFCFYDELNEVYHLIRENQFSKL